MLCKDKFILFLILFTCFFSQLSQAQTWLGGNQTPFQSSALHAIAHDGTQFVTVGDTGTVLTSPDGITWTAQTSGIPNALSGITWNGTLFVTVGQAGTILSSVDAITWVDRTFATGAFLLDVTWGGTQFVAVGTGGMILTSPDGIVWTLQTTTTTAQLNGVTWDGAQFLIIGDPPAGSPEPAILTSPDGITWTSQVSGLIGWLSGVVWNGTQFIAVGGTTGLLGGVGSLLVTSPNGTTWTSQISITGQFLTRIAWNGVQFVTVGTLGTIFVSNNGINWLTQVSNTLFNLNAVGVGGAQFVVVGNTGTSLHSGLSITNKNIVLDMNGITTAQVNTTAGTAPLTYASSNTAVANVSNTGLVSLVDIGTASITVTDFYSNTDSATVQVTHSLLSSFINGNYTPIVYAPNNLSIVSNFSGGVDIADPQLTFFLSGSTAIDTEDGDLTPAITNNAPATFPEGQITTVVFSVTDSYGSTNTANATVDVALFPMFFPPAPVAPAPVAPAPAPVAPAPVAPAPPNTNTLSPALLNNTNLSQPYTLSFSTTTANNNNVVTVVNGPTLFPFGINTISLTETNNALAFTATDHVGTNNSLQSTLNNPIVLAAAKPNQRTTRQPVTATSAAGCSLIKKSPQNNFDPLLLMMVILSCLWLRIRRVLSTAY